MKRKIESPQSGVGGGKRLSSGPRPPTPDPRRPTFASRLRKVRLFLCDVDGILTNATVFMGSGREFKQFHIRDGLGLRLLQREGIKVGWISNRPSAATAARAEDLQIDFLFQEQGSKVAAAAAILKKTGFAWGDIAYMGDDIVDLALMKRAGVALTVPDAIDEVKALADYITTAHGGNGAVREAVGLILRAQGRWDKLIREFSA
jgi:3-deoxy-D-manno-octulosonate 8-phosphate phosphatase (KDO 8-P phosphatase)